MSAARCPGSGRRVRVSPGQERQTAGYVRSNQATDVRCPVCGHVSATARVVHADHGIPTGPTAIVPVHR